MSSLSSKNGPKPIFVIYRDSVPMAWRPTIEDAMQLVAELVEEAQRHYDTSPHLLRITHGQKRQGHVDIVPPVVSEDIIYAQELSQDWYLWHGKPAPLVVFTCREVPYSATTWAQKPPDCIANE